MEKMTPRVCFMIGAVTAAALAVRCTPAPSARPAPAGMKWITAGEFVMGTDDPDAMSNERPAHRVRLDGFWMDEHAVTNAEFRAFVEATGYVTTAEKKVDWQELRRQLPPGTPPPPDALLQPGALVFTPPDHPVDLENMANWWTWRAGANWRHPQGPDSSLDAKNDYPVVQVSWDDAAAFAAWAGKSLPTEAQWEYAARGGLPRQTRYPWGDDFKLNGRFMANTFTGDFPFRNTAEDGFARLAPGKSFPPNAYGLYDMAGNVWNWCADFYADDVHARTLALGLCCNPGGPGVAFRADGPLGPQHVTKGGSFLCSDAYCASYRPTARRGVPYDTASEHVGFRCARSG